MPDPIDELENFSTPGLTMNPLPASEVRRRGTRMRRRNHAIAAIGGVAAVAIIATPLAMAASNTRTDTNPPVTNPSPSVTWVTAIPADFPLASGLPRATAQDPYEAQADADACDGLGWSPDGPPAAVDVQQVVQTENEGGVDRALAVYADADAATQARLALEARVQECATATDGKARSTELVSSDGSSLVYLDHVSDAGDMFEHRALQVGNALLLDTVYSLGGGDPTVVQRNLQAIERLSAPAVDAMCVFSADPC
ncbi:hypothetical protein ASC77_25765 [Nocardioides sp. Root1257]|uniref:hypothetical protein n=1 Tax=unclassified Nocardioides TaxID=2615069 RepID=UPI0006F2F8B6|nr:MULTISPECIES: hypothetical protein [unclassified Nocardioides]KQW49916.1 hypothetical protein ASC77_25765 [Nocardioides sp. Root1257]KRC43362.1 hypothetical protein ASE24_20580 [Nocardioides sp. Root224]